MHEQRNTGISAPAGRFRLIKHLAEAMVPRGIAELAFPDVSQCI